MTDPRHGPAGGPAPRALPRALSRALPRALSSAAAALALLGLLAVAPAPALGQPGDASAEQQAPTADPETISLFRQSCTSCHTIGGGRLVGPDLKDVSERKDRAWLAKFIVDPKTVLASGDPYAEKLRQEANGAVMPPVPGMTAAKAEKLLDLIAAESQLEKSQFAGLTITDEPFTPQTVATGRALFVGTDRLDAGGPACVSCHGAAGLGGLGGGRLAPDLTKVYERLGGRKGLAAWLQAPATETMRPLFAKTPLSNEEVLALTAFLEDEAKTRAGAGAGGARLTFLLLGLGGAIGFLMVADAVWRKRLRGVRRFLLRGVR